MSSVIAQQGSAVRQLCAFGDGRRLFPARRMLIIVGYHFAPGSLRYLLVLPDLFFGLVPVRTERLRIYVRDRITYWPMLASVATIFRAVRPEASYATCSSCGRDRVDRLKREDQIEPVSKPLWSTLQRFFGGKLYRCPACRLQFYDCRKQRPARAGK
jgi:hypothetical protein